MLEKAIALAKAGDKDAARALLRQLVAEDPYNEQAWGWLAHCAKNEEERVAGLERVVELYPNNGSAQAALNKSSRLRPSRPRRLRLHPHPTAHLGRRQKTTSAVQFLP